MSNLTAHFEMSQLIGTKLNRNEAVDEIVSTQVVPHSNAKPLMRSRSLKLHHRSQKNSKFEMAETRVLRREFREHGISD